MDKRERARRYIDGYAEGMDAYVQWYRDYSAPLPGSSALAKEQPGCSPECPCMHTEEGWQQGWRDAEVSCNL
jgi:hypothetical protein